MAMNCRHPAVVDAINNGDEDAFVAAFAPDGHIDDWGRVLSGQDGVRGWAQTRRNRDG